MTSPNFSFENKIWSKGFKHIAGVDEVGRGCFAGPVVAAAVVFAPNYELRIMNNELGIRIDDSKKLTSLQREKAEKWIKENAITWGIGEGSPSLINRMGMGKATKAAFRRAVKTASSKLKLQSSNLDYILLDAFFIPYLNGFPKGRVKIKGSKNPKFKNGARQLAIIKGDEKSISIAAASIIAKVYRDKLMISLSEKSKYKKYGWERNKGYGTKEHRRVIVKYGITGFHRNQFINTYLRKFNGAI